MAEATKALQGAMPRGMGLPGLGGGMGLPGNLTGLGKKK
jgi:signal recognition particle subunit SRP54